MRRIILIALATIVAASCTKNEINTKTPNSLIAFRGGMTTDTKAPIVSDGSGFIPTGLTGIQILRATDAASAVWTGVSTVATTADIAATGTVTIATAQYYNSDVSKNSFFLSYYPIGTLTANKVNWTITGQEDIISSTSADAGNKTSPVNPVILPFSHLLTQLQFEVVADAAAIAAWGTLTYIKISAPTALELTLSTNTIAANATPVIADIPTSISGSATQTLTTTSASAGVLMVLPTTYTTVKIKTSLGLEQSITITGLPSPTLAGSSYLITLTFNAASITFSATLTDWTTGATGTGSVD